MNEIKGSHEKSVNAITHLLSKKSYVVAPVVLTKYNIQHIERTLDFIYNLGVRGIMINRYNIGGSGCNNASEMLPEKDDLINAYEKCNRFAVDKNIKLYSLVCTPRCILNPEDYSNIMFSNCGCNNKKRIYTLSRDGKVRFCNHSPNSLGNIFTGTIKDVINSEKLALWGDIEPQFCAPCSSKESCRYGCRAVSEQMGYGLSKEDPIIDIYEVKDVI